MATEATAAKGTGGRPEEEARDAVEVPFVVDLDGTLIKVDSLQEAFVQLPMNMGFLQLVF